MCTDGEMRAENVAGSIAKMEGKIIIMYGKGTKLGNRKALKCG